MIRHMRLFFLLVVLFLGSACGGADPITDPDERAAALARCEARLVECIQDPQWMCDGRLEWCVASSACFDIDFECDALRAI